MSAAAHKEAALREAQQAEAHQAMAERNNNDLWRRTKYAPSGFPHNVHAMQHRARMGLHEAAAKELERFEQEQCTKFPPETRAESPLVGPVQAVKLTEKGIELSLDKAAPVDAVVDHMRCHAAFARTKGYQGMADCPLYFKGVRIEKAGEHAVAILSDDPDVLAKLHDWARLWK